MLFRRSAKWLVSWVFAVALFTVAGACGAFFLHIHEENGALQGLRLPLHPPPGPGSAILVVAPHSDDETLGAGGVLAEAVRAGARVHVVLMTNGDGFRVAAARRYHKIRPVAETYIRLAYDRQQETLDALGTLGVKPEQVTFLGYPDGGLAPMWTSYWGPDRLYTSRYTRCSTSPYRNAYRPGAPYCGQAALRDLEAVMRAFQPTEVYLPHPCDDHPDHWATHCYGAAALERLRAEAPARDGTGPVLIGAIGGRAEWALRAQVYCYLVHRGDWPVPQGTHVNARLVPPATMLNLDTRWERLPLDADARAAKERALECYRSQTAVMGRFLRSFLRRDELFGVLPPRPVSALASVDGAEETYVNNWDRYLPAVEDGSRDTLLRGIDGSGDLTAVYAAAGPERLHLRLVTRRSLSPRITYRLRLRPVGCDDPTIACAPITLSFTRYHCNRPGVSYAYRRSGLEISIPLADLGHPRALFVGADSGGPGVIIDRIAWRVLRLPHAPSSGTAS